MTARTLLEFLRQLTDAELDNKQVRLEVAVMDNRPLLDIDEADPDFIFLKSFVGIVSEN